jgi:hypothetical protein
VEQDFENPRLWEAPKPFLLDYYVPFSVYDPSFHTWKATKHPAPLDPCCTSCREPGDAVTVCVYATDESYVPTWEFILANRETIENALKAKLQAVHERNLVQRYDENLEGMPDWEKHWKFILGKLGEDEKQITHRMFKLTGISIAYSDPEGEWVVGYEFQTGWDMDHGLEIVMWGDRVLAAAGLMELTSTGGSVFAGVRSTQEYELDPGDFPLPAEP